MSPPPPDNVTAFAALHPALIDPRDEEAYQRAWAAFCQCYEPRIRAWAARLGLDAAQIDEITSRVLVKLVKALPQFRYDPARSFSGWLRTIVVHEVRDFWASAVRRPGGVGLGGTDAQEALQQHADADAACDELVTGLTQAVSEREAKVRRAVAAVQQRVQPKTWQAFELLTCRGLSGKEAAEQTGLSVAAVHVARSRVAAMLREELQTLGVPG